jgi:tetratricopeptide (TPR) repeat protein
VGGRAALALGHPDAARDRLEKAFAKNRLPESAWRLGDALSALGDVRSAEQAYERVIAEGRRGDKRTLALFLATKNRSSAEALRLAEAEMKVRPGVYTEDVLAWALYRNGRIEEAKSLVLRATELGTLEPLFLYHAGAIRLKAGESKARELIERALAVSPNFDPTAAAEARALLEETAHVR